MTQHLLETLIGQLWFMLVFFIRTVIQVCYSQQDMTGHFGDPHSSGMQVRGQGDYSNAFEIILDARDKEAELNDCYLPKDISGSWHFFSYPVGKTE